MGESRFFFLAVAFTAIVQVMTITAHVVAVIHLRSEFRSLSKVVAVATAFVLVATNAGKIEQVDVLLVVERDNRPLVVLGVIDFRFGGYDLWMRDTHNVSRIHRSSHRLARLRQVADDTPGIVAPFEVTAHALPVVGALKCGLAKIVGTPFDAVTFPAGRNFPGRRIVVANGAAAAHLRHLGVRFMAELHRLV